MSTYLYEAFDKDGTVVRGEFDAQGKGEVLEHLLRRSLKPVSIRALRDGSQGLSRSFFNRLSSVDVLFLVRNLSTTIKAGMSIVESLDVLIADTDKPFLRSMLQRVQAGIKSGQQLSVEFEAYKKHFPAAFIGMLKAGEISGALDKTLDSLAVYLTKEFQLRSQVRSALVYPTVLLCASLGVITLLLGVVLPKLTKAFTESKIELPLLTRIFIGISNALTYSLILDVLIVGFLAWLFFYFRRTSLGKRIWQSTITHLPIAKDVIRKVAIVRFTRTFGNLIGSGISAIEALEISADSLGNAEYAAALHAAARDLERGVSLSHSLERSPQLFPRILVGLIVVGERTGSLSPMLLSLSEFYDEEVSNRLKNLTSVLEPLLLLVMGVVVGAIALSILLPIYQLVGKVG